MPGRGCWGRREDRVWGMGLEALIGLESPLHDLGIPLQIRVSI